MSSSVEKLLCAGPGAPHGAWPLAAADVGTRGCRGPAHPTSLEGRHRPELRGLSRAASCTRAGGRAPGGPLARAGRRASACARPPPTAPPATARPVATTRANAEARNSTSAKSDDRDAAQHVVDHRPQLVGTGRVGDAGDRRRHLGVCPAGLELARHADRVGVHPLPQQVEPPQAPGERVGRRARPQLGDRLDALGLGEVQQPLADGFLVRGRALRAR